MTDKTTFINTAYIDEQSEADFFKSVSEAFRQFCMNKAEAKGPDSLDKLKSQIMGANELQNICNMLHVILMNFANHKPENLDLVMKFLNVRSSAMKMLAPKVIFAVDAALAHLVQTGELPDPKDIAEEMVERGILTEGEAKAGLSGEAGDTSDLVGTFLKRMAQRKSQDDMETVGIKLNNENAKEFLMTVQAALEQDEEFVFWQGQKLPIQAAAMVAEQVMKAIEEMADEECDCPNCRAAREASQETLLN
jgi:hypothetical protein